MEAKKLVITADVRENFEQSTAEHFAPVSCLPPLTIIPYDNDYVEITIELLEDRTSSTAYLSTCRTRKGSVFFVFVSLCENVDGVPAIRKQFINMQEYNDFCATELKDMARNHPYAIL